jgi:hypothetical protein
VEELDIDEATEDGIKLLALKIAEKKADLMRRQAQWIREMAQLEQAEKYLETTKVSLGVVLNSLLTSNENETLNFDSIVAAGQRSIGATGPTGPINHGEIRRALFETISRFTPRPFSTTELLNFLKLWHPLINVDGNRANINAYLKEFIDEEVITLEREGSGNRPAIYRRLPRLSTSELLA